MRRNDTTLPGFQAERATDGARLRAHYLRLGLIRESSRVETETTPHDPRLDLGPVLAIDGARRYRWADLLDDQHDRKDHP